MANEIKSYSTTETASLIRQELKAAFPSVKFSVRSKSYSGGSSINVSWTDGPTSQEVDRVAGSFAGASFDGMIDLKSYHESNYQGQRVRFGADFVFTNRKVSADLLKRAVRYANRKYGWTVDADAVVVQDSTYAYITRTPETMAHPFNHFSVADICNQIAHTMRQDGIIIQRMNSSIQPEPETVPVVVDEQVAAAEATRPAIVDTNDAEYRASRDRQPVIPDVVGEMKKTDVRRLVGELWKTSEEYHAGAINHDELGQRNRATWDEVMRLGLRAEVSQQLRDAEKVSRHA